MKTSAGPSAAALPCALKPTAPAKPHAQPRVGTLWSMRQSPFSRAVHVVLSLSGRVAHEVAFVPLLSALSMWVRLRFARAPRRITAPILRTSEARPRYLLDSFDIARHVDAARADGRPTLFPRERADAIARFNRHAGALNAFMRARLLERLRADADAAQRLFMPRALRGRFFSRAVVRACLAVFARKYRRESGDASRAVAREALEAVRAGLARCEGRHLRYLCGERLTYADIIMAESIFFDAERHGRWGHLYADREFAEEFPDVVAWARAVRVTHYAGLSGRRKGAQ